MDFLEMKNIQDNNDNDSLEKGN